MSNFREWFHTKLQDGVAEIVFEKVNGDMREMKCTLDANLIETSDEWTAKDKEEDFLEASNLVVWDVEASAWRSFRWEALTSYKFSKPEENQFEMFQGISGL